MSVPVERTPAQERKYQDHLKWLAKPGNREKHRECCAKSQTKYRQKRLNYQAEYRARTGSIAVRKHNYKKFGLTVEAYDVLDRQQNHVCAICHTRQKRRLAIDHDHETGIVRGLLCDLCNRGLGYFKDVPERLRLAAEYLERTKR